MSLAPDFCILCWLCCSRSSAHRRSCVTSLPIVTGPVIIAIGLTLSQSAIDNCGNNWLVALVAILVVIIFNIWGKGMLKIIPILLGVVASYVFSMIVDAPTRATLVDHVSHAAWIGLPVKWENTRAVHLRKQL